MNKKNNINNKVISLRDKKRIDNNDTNIAMQKGLLSYYDEVYKYYIKQYKPTKKPNNFLIIINELTSYFNNNNDKIDLAYINNKIKNLFNEFAEFIDIYYHFIFDNKFYIDKKLYEMMNYSFLGCGKKVRALLFFLVCYMYCPLPHQIMSVNSFMLAIELIHTFSLIHDDLPAIDNDEIRRHKASAWKKFGEASAILTGDAILNQAYFILNYTLNYNIMMQMDNIDKITNKILNISDNEIYFMGLDDIRRHSLAIVLLSESIGIDGLISGELEDTINNSELSYNDVLKMYNNKTGKLIYSSMLIPSCLVYSDENVKNLF